jgi:hypothetical protein
LLEVWAGVSHCRAVHFSVVDTLAEIVKVWPLGTLEGRVMLRGAP